MKGFKKLFSFYIFSNIHVGIATACLVFVSMYDLQRPVIPNSSYFVFFSTVLAYHFIRVFENCDCTVDAVTSYLRKQSLAVLLVSFSSFIGTIYFSFFIGIRYLWILLPVAFVTFWYAVPLFKYKGKRISLRNYPTLKIVSIALVWATSTVLFPLQESLAEVQVWLEFAQRFFLIMALVIPFDVRDLHKDATHLQTFPQKIGVSKAKKVGMQYLVVFFILGFFKMPLDECTLIPALLVFILSLLLVVKTKENQSKYYAAFWVESIPIIWLGMLWGMEFLV